MLRNAVLLSLSFVLACSCNLEAENPTPPSPRIIVQATNLTGNFWTNSAWNDPCVLVLNDSSYRMYLSRNTDDLYTDGRAEPVSYFMPNRPMDWNGLYTLTRCWDLAPAANGITTKSKRRR
jgi:hypothetical protein